MSIDAGVSIRLLEADPIMNLFLVEAAVLLEGIGEREEEKLTASIALRPRLAPAFELDVNE